MEIRRILKTALFTPGLNGRWGLPLMFWGKPGVGKSRQIEGACAALGLACVTLIASLRDPTDFGGLPIPSTREGGKGSGKPRTFVEYAPSAWGADLAIEGRGTVFVDEITTTAPATQAALLRMELDGALGDFTLPGGIRFLNAGNEARDAAGGWDLAPPLANRFGHLQFETPDVQAWSEWLIGANGGHEDQEEGQNFDPAAEEARVMVAWPKAFAQAKGLVAAFVRARAELLFKMPEHGSGQISKAWPSPRTWEMFTRARAGSMVHDLDGVHTDELGAAFVGPGAASEFTTFALQADLPDPEHVLDGKIKFKHDPARLDRTAAVLSACSAYVTSKGIDKQNERAGTLWTILDACSDDAADVTVPPARALVRARLMPEEARPVLRKLQPVLAAAGVRPQ